MTVTATVSFVLSPFIVHHLGNAAYGTWILVNSVVAYLALLDFGMRGTVVKFVSSDYARQEHEHASQAVSAAFWFRLWIGAAIVGVSVLLSLLAPRFFHLPAELMYAARWAMLLNGTTVAVALTFGVFGGVLTGFSRFDTLSQVSIVQTLLNASGVYLLLRNGKGIIAMAMLQSVLVLASGIASFMLARRAYPQLRIYLRWPDKLTVRQVWGYSVFIFIIAISGQVIYYTDNIVIGAFLPVSAVAFYGIGAALTNYLRNIIASAATTFMPIASRLDAEGNREALKRLLFQGTRMVMLIALPIEIGFVVRGPTFLRVWMGQEFMGPSGHVLRLLTISWIFITGNYVAGNIIYGLSKHKPFAIWTMAEAVCNLLLSIVLIRPFGIFGVAWGTVIPSLVTNAIIWPIYVSRVLHVRWSRYIWEAWLRPALAQVPFVIACYFADRYWHTARVWSFILQMVVLLPAALLGVAAVFRGDLRALLAKGRGALVTPAPVASDDGKSVLAESPE